MGAVDLTKRTMADAAHHVEAAVFLLSGKRPPDTRDYRKSRGHLQRYLDACAPNAWLSAAELINPRSESVAKALGLVPADFIPPMWLWPWSALLRRLHRGLRMAAGTPVWVYNHFRPTRFNTAVGGKPASDHLHAAAIDCLFSSRIARRAGERWLRPYVESGVFRMSIGRGARNLHVGVFAPQTMRRGVLRREWRYGNAEVA